MKYLKTKKGTISEIYYDDPTTDSYIIKNCKSVPKKEIVLVSDKLQDLIEDYIVVYANGDSYMLDLSPTDKFIKAKEYLKYLDADAVIYGVIWTTGPFNEPIIKSVAKLKQGEEDLKLIAW